MPWAGRVVATAAALIVAALPALAPAPAHAAAAPGDVLVSSDGLRFGLGIDALFDGNRLLVPGGSTSSSVWIRNDGEVSAAMRMTLRDAIVSSDEFADAVKLGITEPDSGSMRERSLAAWGGCAVLASSPAVQPGETVKVDLGLAMTDVDGLIAQGQTADLTMVVAMRDGGAGAFPASACQDDGVIISTGQAATDPQRMARTGSELPTHLFVIGGALSGAGVFFAIAGRRKRTR